MKIEVKNEQKKIVQQVTVRVAKFTPEDIERIIKKELEAEGFTTEGVQISFSVGSKYVEDEWGMNRHITSFFKGASARWEHEHGE